MGLLEVKCELRIQWGGAITRDRNSTECVQSKATRHTGKLKRKIKGQNEQNQQHFFSWHRVTKRQRASSILCTVELQGDCFVDFVLVLKIAQVVIQLLFLCNSLHN
jgi:hypothetical protein